MPEGWAGGVRMVSGVGATVCGANDGGDRVGAVAAGAGAGGAGTGARVGDADGDG